MTSDGVTLKAQHIYMYKFIVTYPLVPLERCSQVRLPSGRPLQSDLGPGCAHPVTHEPPQQQPAGLRRARAETQQHVTTLRHHALPRRRTPNSPWRIWHPWRTWTGRFALFLPAECSGLHRATPSGSVSTTRSGKPSGPSPWGRTAARHGAPPPRCFSQG